MPAMAADWDMGGERLYYTVSLLGLNIGRAELAYAPVSTTYTLTMRAWTTGTAGSFYNVNNALNITGGHSAKMPFATESYHLIQTENDYRANKKVVYDRAHSMVTFTNLHAKEPPQTFAQPPDVRDMVSALYYLRAHAQNPRAGQKFVLNVFDLTRAYTMTVTVGKPYVERTILNKRTPVLPIILNLQEVAGKRKTSRWDLLVSADERMIPVRISGSLPFGRVSATLRAIGGGAAQSEAPPLP
jgi:hypothetical protein